MRSNGNQSWIPTLKRNGTELIDANEFDTVKIKLG